MSRPGDRAPGHPSDRLLALAALASTVLLSAAACFRKIWGVDFWWQYRTGRYVAEQGWPSVDVFSYTVPGEPWIELRWLYCLTQYAIFERFGAEALVTLKWLAVVAAFALVTLPVFRAKRLAAASFLLAVALLATSQRFFVRPELVTYVMFGLFVLIAWRYRLTATRWIWALPVLQVVWVNSHTLFILGPLLVGLLLCVTLVDRWRARPQTDGGAAGSHPVLLVALVWAATALACLANPYTWEGVLFPFRLFGEIRGDSAFNQVIEEFSSPFVVGFSFTAIRYYVLLIVLAVLSAALNWRRLDPFWTVLCVSQLYLSTLAVRNIPLFALAAVPFVLDNLDRSDWWESRPARWKRLAGRAACLVTIAGCAWYCLELATDRFNLRQNDSNRFGAGIAEHRYPEQAVDFVQSAGVTGRILSTMGEAAYLISRDRQVFIDPRLEVYGEAWLRRYLAVQQNPAAFQAVVREFDLRVVLVPLQSNLARFALVHPGWSLVHFDEVAAVFARADSLGSLQPIASEKAWDTALGRVRASVPAAPAYSARGLFERVTLPDPYLAVADFLLMAGRTDEAELFLEDARRAWPSTKGLELRRATLAELRGDREGVVREAESGLRRTPDDPRLQIKLATALARLGRPEEARAWFERSLEGRPDRATTWGHLGGIHARQDRLEDAERCFARAVELAPREAGYLADLARIRARSGRTDEAIAGMDQALRLAPGDTNILRDLALIHAGAGDTDAARRYVAQGLALDPTEPTLIRLRERLADYGR